MDNGTDSGGDPNQTSNPQEDPEATGSRQQSDPESASHQDEVVTLSREDYNALISQRDKNDAQRQQTEESKQELENRLQSVETEQQKTQAIDRWLEQNSDDFPDVSREDLQLASSPDDVEDIAKRVQGKADRIREQEMEKAKQPADNTISTSDYQQKEQELRDSEDPQAFEKMVSAQMQVDPNK